MISCRSRCSTSRIYRVRDEHPRLVEHIDVDHDRDAWNDHDDHSSASASMLLAIALDCRVFGFVITIAHFMPLRQTSIRFCRASSPKFVAGTDRASPQRSSDPNEADLVVSPAPLAPQSARTRQSAEMKSQPVQPGVAINNSRHIQPVATRVLPDAASRDQ